jgi:hypothetical protein
MGLSYLVTLPGSHADAAARTMAMCSSQEVGSVHSPRRTGCEWAWLLAVSGASPAGRQQIATGLPRVRVGGDGHNLRLVNSQRVRRVEFAVSCK